MEKLKSQVNVIFWFSGKSDILVLTDVPPPPEIEIGLNMNAIEPNHFKRDHQVHFTIYPLPFQYHYLILCLNRKLVNFISNGYGYMDSNPIHHPSPGKNMKCSFLDYVQLLMIGQAD